MKQEVHTYLFLLDEGNIYRYQVKKKGVSLLKYKNDEKSRPFSGDFWEDWMCDAGFADGDKVDFAFLSDDNAFKFTGYKKFSFAEPTEYFNTGKIEQFMEDKLEYNNLSFEFNGREKEILKCKLGYKGPKKFYLSIPYPSDETLKYHKPSSEDEFNLGIFIQERAERMDKNCKT